MKLSTDCQPIVMHTLRIVIIGRLVFAFLTSNPTIFRVPHFKSDHFAGFGGFSQLTAGFWWVFAAYGWVFRLACWVFLPYGWVFRLRNDKVNSLLRFGNRTKVTENIPLFGGPYRNSHRQFFYSPKKNAKKFVLVFFFEIWISQKFRKSWPPPRDQILNEKVKTQ